MRRVPKLSSSCAFFIMNQLVFRRLSQGGLDKFRPIRISTDMCIFEGIGDGLQANVRGVSWTAWFWLPLRQRTW